jgi:hypothetical protein
VQDTSPRTWELLKAKREQFFAEAQRAASRHQPDS